MKEWMTIKDLSEYLQISEKEITTLVRNKSIPSYNNHGFLRFKKNEIDEWMMTPAEKKIEVSTMRNDFEYRGKSIEEYVLTASVIFLSSTAWLKLPEFIIHALNILNLIEGRDYLYRDEFKPLDSNFNDYLRVGCQLGLIENRKEEERKKHYYFTDFSKKLYEAATIEEKRKIIQDSILDIVSKNRESLLGEKHAIYLLWYYLSLKKEGIDPKESHFRKELEGADQFPQIRLNFSKKFSEFLFDGNEMREISFFRKVEFLNTLVIQHCQLV